MMKFNPYNYNFFISLFHPFNRKKRIELRNKKNGKKQEEFLTNFHNEAPKALEIFSQAIQNYSKPVRIWLEFGTLLGAYRDQKIISHDTDIDFGIDENDAIPDFFSHLSSYGFSIEKKFIIHSNDKNINGFIAEYTLKYGKYTSIDLFVFKQENGKSICFSFDREEGLSYRMTQKKYNNKLRTIKIVLPYIELKETLFLNSGFNIPFNTEKHLSEIYGKDFMTPIKYSYDNRIKDYEIILDNQTLGESIKY